MKNKINIDIETLKLAIKCIAKAESEGVYNSCVMPQIGKVTLDKLYNLIKSEK